MNEDFRLDLREIIQSIETADVISIFFPMFRKSLVMDTRFTAEDKPVARIMPMTGSVEERYRSIRRMRPQMPRPENLAVIPWTRHIDSMVNTGIWRKLVERFVESGHKDSVHALQGLLKELHQLEKLEMAAVVRGENYHTVWSRSS